MGTASVCFYLYGSLINNVEGKNQIKESTVQV